MTLTKISGRSRRDRSQRGMYAIAFAGLWLAYGSLFGNGQQAFAADVGQDDKHQRSAAPKAGLEEIVVTARKRGENLQKTPLKVTAISGADLKRAGITNAEGLTAVVPGLEVGSLGSTTQFTIRGITSNTDPNLGDSPTAFHIDGIYQGRPASASGLFYDVSRIEVLSGPQGTLYGKDSTGGTINLITNKPNFTGFNGELDEEIANYNRFRTFAMLNVPVSPTFAVRVALQDDEHNGYLNSGYDDASDIAVRLHALWQPNENFSALATQDYFHQGGFGNGQIPIPQAGDYWRGNPWSVRSDALQAQGAAGLVGSSNNRSAQTSLQLNWNFGPADLTSVSAYHRLHLDANSFLNGTPSLQKETDDEISQEIRLSSHANSDIKWVVGAYYHRERQSNDLYFYNQAGPGVDSVQLFPLIKTPSYAFFGQATYPILPSLRVTAGLRLSNDEKTIQGSIAQYNYLVTDYNGPIVDRSVLVPPGIVPQAAPVGSLTAQRLTYHVGLDQDLTRNSLVFVNYSTGYKQGGLDAAAPPNNIYQPETINAYEIGTKNRFLNGRLQVNLDAYYYDYKNYQVDQLEFFPGQFGIPVFGDFITNAAGARNEGVELETTSLLTESDRLSVNVAFLRAIFKNFHYPNPANPAAPSINFTYSNLSGYTEPSAPEWTGTILYQHSWVLPNDAQIVFYLQSHLETSYWLTANHVLDSRQPAYTQTQLMLQYTSRNGAYVAQAYVHNLENTAVYNNYTFQGPPPAHNYATIDPPRTFGVSFQVRF